jgi:hypothetical protein
MMQNGDEPPASFLQGVMMTLPPRLRAGFLAQGQDCLEGFGRAGVGVAVEPAGSA